MTNPVALTTTVWGNGPRRALLLHGLTSAGSTWWRTAAALTEVGFTVVAPDLRGHGASPSGDFMSLHEMGDDVRLLGNGWDLLIGHSLGGAVAAVVIDADPDFAKRVILEDPAIDSNVTARFLEDSPPLRNPTVAAVAALNPGWLPRDVELKVEALLACGPEIADRVLRDAAPWDVWPWILAADNPMLIVGADTKVGSLVSEEREVEIAANPSATRFVRIPGAGHSMHRDAFDRFFDLVREFTVE